MRLQGLPVGYRGLQGVTGVRKSYMGLQGVTESYKASKRVTWG